MFGEVKPKVCDVCGKPFIPFRSLARVCSPKCAKKLIAVKKATERKEIKARKQALQTIPQLIKIAQASFNAYIRERDRYESCICCDRPLGSGQVGGAFDCGHYRSVGSAPHLRFDERNAHGQRKDCNRYGAGRAVDYRIGLIARRGIEVVEALENNNEVHKWTAPELREIAATFRNKRRELVKQREQGLRNEPRDTNDGSYLIYLQQH